MRIVILLLITFLSACASISETNIVSENNKDVLILCLLVQDHIRKTDGRDVSLAEVLKQDTLSRISNSFETIELITKGGYISVYYKFSASRNSNGIALSEKEKELTHYFRWAEKDLKNHYDGEMRFDYGERFYRVIKLTTNKQNTNT